MPTKRRAKYRSTPKFNPRSTRKYRRWAARIKKRRKICERCKKVGRVTEGEQLHHKVPISEGGALMSRANVELLCKPCHDMHHYGKVIEEKEGLDSLANHPVFDD